MKWSEKIWMKILKNINKTKVSKRLRLSTRKMRRGNKNDWKRIIINVVSYGFEVKRINLIQFNSIQFIVVELIILFQNRTTPTVNLTQHFWPTIPHCTPSLSHSIQYNTKQYNIVRHSTIQYNTIQYNTIQYNTIQDNSIQYNESSCITDTLYPV